MRNIDGSGGLCYRYLAADAICLLVDFSVDIDSSTYGWEYIGGCFPDGKAVNYVQGVPGTEYDFDNIHIVVREYRKSLAEQMGSSFSLSGLFSLLSKLCLIGAIAVAVPLAIELVNNRSKSKAPPSGEQEMGNPNKHRQLEDEGGLDTDARQ